jgi:hypothetical protein
MFGRRGGKFKKSDRYLYYERNLLYYKYLT